MNDLTMKRVRRAKGITLKQLADLTGISQTFLSEIENGKGNPTIDTLRKVASCLDLSLFDLLAEDEHFHEIIRAKERRVLRAPDFNLEWELVSNMVPGAKTEVVMAWLHPGAATSNNRQSHGKPGGCEEIALVLAGTIQMELEEETHILREGDSIRFNPWVPHRYANSGESRAGLLVIMTPPSF